MEESINQVWAVGRMFEVQSRVWEVGWRAKSNQELYRTCHSHFKKLGDYLTHFVVYKLQEPIPFIVGNLN